MGLVQHPTGNYWFLPGIAPYSCGVVSCDGYEIVSVVFHDPRPYREGFRLVRERLEREGRPLTALCSISLRSPVPFTFDGFAAFNAEYTQILADWKVYVDGVNPIARTNIAPVLGAPAEPVLYGFGYTRPTTGAVNGRTFIVAGAGELPEGVLARDAIVALGDTTDAGLARKAQFVLDLMSQRLSGLGCAWNQVRTANVYSCHNLMHVVPEWVLPRLGPAAIHGVRWHFSRPPVEEIEFEMDLIGAVIAS